MLNLSPFTHVPANAMFGKHAIPTPIMNRMYGLSLPEAQFVGQPEEEKAPKEAMIRLREIANGVQQLGYILRNMAQYRWEAKKLIRKSEDREDPQAIFRHVYDANGQLALPGVAKLVLAEGASQEEISKASVAAQNAFHNSSLIYQTYRDVSFLGFKIPQPQIALVNAQLSALEYGFMNAMYAASMIPFPLTIYGKGDGLHFNDLSTSFDVMAHEYAHVYVMEKFKDKFSPLQGQMGAVHEHLADVIAKAGESKVKNWGPVTDEEIWKIGADILVDPDSCIRNMLYPGTAFKQLFGEMDDPQPAHMSDYRPLSGFIDAGGIHINNGILNRLFALYTMYSGEPIHERPFLTWKRAIKTVPRHPDFFTFGRHLATSADKYGLKKEFMQAAGDVGIFDHEVRPDQFNLKVVSSPFAGLTIGGRE